MKLLLPCCLAAVKQMILGVLLIGIEHNVWSYATDVEQFMKRNLSIIAAMLLGVSAGYSYETR